MNVKLITAAALSITLGSAAHAANLVYNGGFELVDPTWSVYGHNGAALMASTGQTPLSPGGCFCTATPALGWDYSWEAIGNLFTADALSPAKASTYGGYYSNQVDDAFLLYTNGLGVDPNGGNFIGLDGDHDRGALSQTINGLVAGKSYTLTFYQASDHYTIYNQLQKSQLHVSLGGQTELAPEMDNHLTDVNPWSKVTMNFTATSSSEVLSFTNFGNETPPYALLDGVSLTAGAPEPASWALMTLGVVGLGGLARRRRALAKA